MIPSFKKALFTLSTLTFAYGANAVEIKRVDLPEKVTFKTKTETFNQDHYFAVRECRIWVKPNTEVTGKKENWGVLGPFKGFPGNNGVLGRFQFDSEDNCITEVSADGDNLIALDKERVIYYTKLFALNKWKAKWGLPFPKTFKMPKDALSWSISHRGPYMEYYNDIDGNKHRTGPGVTTLYMMPADGNHIFYADPWIPAKWGGHQADMPYRGRMIARKMAASGSTLFLINDAGDLYTRLFDFDTSGQNPALSYSWKREKRTGSRKFTRTLPGEEWKRQLPPIGRYTDKITIFQNGNKGSAGFTLRVEGENKFGETGYFEKDIYASKWNFIRDNRIIERDDLIDAKKAVKSKLFTKSKTEDYKGKISRPGVDFVMKGELVGFSLHSNPATLKLDIAGEKYDIPVYFRGQSEKKGKIKSRATILIPESMKKSRNFYVNYVWKELFKEHSIIDFKIKGNKSKIDFKQDLHIFGLDEIVDIYLYSLYRSVKEKVGLSEAMALNDRELKPLWEKRLKMKFEIKE